MPPHSLSDSDGVDWEFTDGFEIWPLEPRHPGESSLLEVSAHDEIEVGNRGAYRWRFVFAVVDFSDDVTIDKEGPHAVLRTIYRYKEDGNSVEEIAVNGGTLVPQSVLDALEGRDEIVGFGRPPYIPEQDD